MSLRSAILGCWRPLSTLGCRSKSASSGPTTVSRRSTRSGTLRLRLGLFVCFEAIDVLSFSRRCRKRWECWAWSTLLPVVPVEFIIHGRNRSRSHKHDLWSSFVARSKPSSRPEASEGFEVVRACASDQDGQAADTAVTVSKAISSRRHAI